MAEKSYKTQRQKDNEVSGQPGGLTGDFFGVVKRKENGVRYYQPVHVKFRAGRILERNNLSEEMVFEPVAYEYAESAIGRHYLKKAGWNNDV